MAITLYELAGADRSRRFSPYCWRIRMALAHKGLEPETVPVTFSEKDKIAFSDQDKVPVLRDADTVVSDSWRIAEYLDKAYPDRPSLLGDARSRSLTRFVDQWVTINIGSAMAPLLFADIFQHIDENDREYFRTTREKRLGKTLEDAASDKEGLVKKLNGALLPLRQLLKESAYVAGEEPAYADYLAFGHFMWARGVSQTKLLKSDDPIHDWRERMLNLHGGLARNAVGYPV